MQGYFLWEWIFLFNKVSKPLQSILFNFNLYKMRLNIVFYFFIIFLAISCSKVSEQASIPVDQTTSGNYPANFSQLESFLGSGYSNFRKGSYLYGFELLTKHFASLEHTAYLDYKGDGDWNELATHNISTTNPYVDKLWVGLYTGVKNVNVFLDRADFYEANFEQPSEKDSVKQLRGEAYFLRAWYYFQLECFFGESYMTSENGAQKKGLPLFKKMATSLDEASQPRSSVGDVWAFIISDLKNAATNLKGVVRTGNSKGRVSEWAAKGLLGKAYTFCGKYDSAKLVLKDVIDNSGKTLMLYAKYSNAYNALPETNEFNEESLFEINVDRKSSGTGIFTSQTSATDLTTSTGLLWGPMILGLNGVETGGGNTEMSRVNIFVHDNNLKRFGFNLPVYNLVAASGFSGTPSRYNPQMVMDPVYYKQSKDIRANKIADPRLYVSALQPWVDTVGNRDGTQRVPIARAGGTGNVYKQQGWSYKKYCSIDKSIYYYNNCDGANYYLLRMADIYLLYAEACMNSGDNVTALEYINKVHRRAYSLPIDLPASVDYSSLSANTKASSTDVDLINNPLAFERFTELFAEGHWWFDVCRWRLGANEAAYYKTAFPDGTPISQWNDKMYSYPIPSLEMSSNKKMTQADQNPGY